MSTGFKLRVNRKKCTGCGFCSNVCSLEHIGIFQPDFWAIKVEKVSDRRFQIHQCMHCAKCIQVCPSNAIYMDLDRGVIQINPSKCNLCDEGELKCVQYCPMGVIKAPILDDVPNPIKIPFICDMCNNNPACVSNCPSEALSVVELDEKTTQWLISLKN